MQKLRVIGLFGCLIINNYAIEQSEPPTYLFKEPKSPDLRAFKELSNLPIGYTLEGIPAYHFLPQDQFEQEMADGAEMKKQESFKIAPDKSPDWLDVASLFVAQQGDFSQGDSSQRVVPANFAEITASGAQGQPEHSRFADFFKALEDKRKVEAMAAFYQQSNTLAHQTSATDPQREQSRFADFFRQNNQQGPFQTIEAAASLLPGLNPEAQVFRPNANRGGDKRPLEDQKGQVALFSRQQTPGTLHKRRRTTIEPLVLQPPSIPLWYIPLPVVYPGLLPVPIVDQQILSRNAEMENMRRAYYHEKNFHNNGQIHCCRPDCTQGDQVYGHALILHYEGLSKYLDRHGLPY